MTAATGDDETLRAESSLPSIEELTKNVQSLIDKDYDAIDVQEHENKEVVIPKVPAYTSKHESWSIFYSKLHLLGDLCR